MEDLKKKIEDLINRDPNEALELCLEYNIRAREDQDFSREAESVYFLGYANFRLGNYVEAHNYYKSAMAKAKKQRLEVLTQKIQVALGVFYRSIGEISNAIEIYKSALKGPVKEYQGVIYNNIAVIYHQINDFDNALKFYEKALKIQLENQNIEMIIVILLNSGRIYTDTSKFEEAQSYLIKAKEISEETNDDQHLMLANYMLGRLFLRIGDVDQALKALEVSYEINQDKGFKQHSHSISLELAEAYEKSGRLNDAITHYLNSYELSKGLGHRSQIESLTRLKSFYACQHDYLRAYEANEQLLNLVENLHEEDKKQEINKLKTSFELNEKQNEIERLKQENDYKSKLLDQNREIESKNRKLTLMNEELLQFSYAISHDLREPARMINNFSQILEKTAKERLTPQDIELLNYLIGNASKMEFLINDLYKYATLGISENQKKTFDLMESLSSAIQLLSLKIEESNATVKINDLPKVKSYSTLLVQMFQNLISNSIKYRRNDVPIVIEISSTDNEDFHIISIKDNGIGIPEEYQDRIFKIFKRLNNSAGVEGTGIGLAICQKIAAKIGGDITVLSLGENEGSTFRFSIPKN